MVGGPGEKGKSNERGATGRMDVDGRIRCVLEDGHTCWCEVISMT